MSLVAVYVTGSDVLGKTPWLVSPVKEARAPTSIVGSAVSAASLRVQVLAVESMGSQAVTVQRRVPPPADGRAKPHTGEKQDGLLGSDT